MNSSLIYKVLKSVLAISSGHVFTLTLHFEYALMFPRESRTCDVFIGNLKCCCLNSNTLLYTYMYIYIYIYIYIDLFICCVRVIQYLQSHALWFNTFDNMYIHQFHLVNVEQFSSKCLCEVIALHYFGWLVDNSANVSWYESVSDKCILQQCRNVSSTY